MNQRKALFLLLVCAKSKNKTKQKLCYCFLGESPWVECCMKQESFGFCCICCICKKGLMAAQTTSRARRTRSWVHLKRLSELPGEAPLTLGLALWPMSCPASLADFLLSTDFLKAQMAPDHSHYSGVRPFSEGRWRWGKLSVCIAQLQKGGA